MDRLSPLLALAVLAVAGVELTAPPNVFAAESPHSKKPGGEQPKVVNDSPTKHGIGAKSGPKSQPAADGDRKDSVLSRFTSPPQLGLPAETTPKEPALTVAAPTVAAFTELIAKSCYLSANARGPMEHKPKVMVRVNGEPIPNDQLLSAVLPKLVRLHREPEAAKQIQELLDKTRDQFIDREVLYQEAVRLLQADNPRGLKQLETLQQADFDKRMREHKEKNSMSDEQFLENLRRSGVSMDDLRRNARREFIADEYLRSRVWPIIQRETTYPELFAYYEQHAAEFHRQDSVDWEDIFIAIGSKRNPAWEDAQRSAKSVTSRLRHGEPLAQLLDQDDGDSKSRGGDGLGHERSQIDPPQLEQRLFKMKAGQVALVKIATGYHVIRLTRRVHAGQIPFNNETREVITARLRREIAERESKRVVRELRAKAVIETGPDTHPNPSTD
jgi:parvulin-like peptidyl-prolyl isomerase